MYIVYFNLSCNSLYNLKPIKSFSFSTVSACCIVIIGMYKNN